MIGSGVSSSSDTTESPIVDPSTVRRRRRLPKWFEGVSGGLAVASILIALLSATAPFIQWKAEQPTVWAVFAILDICFGAAFFLEFCVRLKFAVVKRKYVCSFMGVVDLLVCLNAVEDLITIKSDWSAPNHEDNFSGPSKFFWLLRFVRLLKLVRYMHEVKLIEEAVRLEARAMLAFVACILILACIIGSIMFVAEGTQDQSAFATIPASIWWAIVTLTTVGYGDMVPKTYAGQIIASVVMLFGYSVLAVPTIVSVLSADNHFLSQFMEAQFSSRDRGETDAELLDLVPNRASVEQEMAVFPPTQSVPLGPPSAPPTTPRPALLSKDQFPAVTLVSTRPSDYGPFGSMTASAQVALIEVALAQWLKEEESLIGMRSGLRMSMAACSFTLMEPLRLNDDYEVIAGVDVVAMASETAWEFQIGLFSKSASTPSLVATVRQTWRSSDGREVKGPERVFNHFKNRRARSTTSLTSGSRPVDSLGSRIGPGVSLQLGSQEAAKAAFLEHKS